MKNKKLCWQIVGVDELIISERKYFDEWFRMSCAFGKSEKWSDLKEILNDDNLFNDIMSCYQEYLDRQYEGCEDEEGYQTVNLESDFPSAEEWIDWGVYDYYIKSPGDLMEECLPEKIHTYIEEGHDRWGSSWSYIKESNKDEVFGLLIKDGYKLKEVKILDW